MFISVHDTCNFLEDLTHSIREFLVTMEGKHSGLVVSKMGHLYITGKLNLRNTILKTFHAHDAV